MDNKLLSSRLRQMAVNTGTLNCLGCGYEHNCGIHGCAVLKRAADIVDSQPKWVSANDPPKEWKDDNGELINYLVNMDGYGVDIGSYLEPASEWLFMGIPVPNVTHWMPLPEPPKS